jgi:glycolate oxidase iron-sulfur subunit
MIFDQAWTRPGLMRTGGSLIGVAGKLGLQKAARSLGLTRLLPGDLGKAEKIMQDIPVRPARSSLKPVNPAVGPRKFRVGYFLGCGTDMFNPSVALATVEVLTSLGCEVIVPPEMKCCGLPHIANGKMDTARTLALHNLEIFNRLELDYIVTDCASCSSALSQKRLELLLAEDGCEHEIQAFCGKLKDLTVFLTEVLDVSEVNLAPQEITVTYHDPCHLAKAQGIRQAPRRLLQQIPGVNLLEMAESDRCCGGSGTFSMTHYDLSMKILGHKMDNIAQTGAQFIATCCPSCALQLRHGTRIYNYGAQVVHPVEILAEALSKRKVNRSA